MRVLLVCSTGGHLSQLYALEGWWQDHERTWVTFDQADARSLLAGEDCVWAHHPTTRNIPNLVRNLWLAVRTTWRARPDLVVSTGAAVAYPFFLAAKLRRTRTVYIEVYDRVERPTLTARLCRPVADRMLVQWNDQTSFFPDARVIGGLMLTRRLAERFAEAPPFRRDGTPAVLVSLGMDHHPFHRLVEWAGAFSTRSDRHRVMVQHGPIDPPPADVTWPFLEFGQLVAAIQETDVVVTHGGPGTIGLALALGKKPVVMPRRSELAEAVDDHQVSFARVMADRGLVHCVEDVEQLDETVRAILDGYLEGEIPPLESGHADVAARFARHVADILA
jgi:UDP-N-acetylglucosamine:LPS N-acetylglucosamine transferase